MKRLFLTAITFVAVSVFAIVALAQSATRVTFAPGAMSKTVSGSLNGYSSHKTYVIRVKKGQTLKTENVGKNHITIGIEAPPGSIYEQDMAADCHDKNEVEPTVAGDYKITVTECRKADPFKGTFKFKVSVH